MPEINETPEALIATPKKPLSPKLKFAMTKIVIPIAVPVAAAALVWVTQKSLGAPYEFTINNPDNIEI